MSKWNGADREHRAATRISVTGRGDCFLVRAGSGNAVRVWVAGADLHCECGRTRCAHVTALQMCGFVEAANDQLQAA